MNLYAHYINPLELVVDPNPNSKSYELQQAGIKSAKYNYFLTLLSGFDKQVNSTDSMIRQHAIESITKTMQQVADVHHSGLLTRDQFQMLVNKFNPRHYYDYKIISKRIPELTKSAERVKSGQMSHEEYQKVIDKYKPISKYRDVPKPASDLEMLSSLFSDKKVKVNQPVANGDIVNIRLDIPAYTTKGTWVPTIHKGNTVISHRSTTVLSGDIKFLCGRKKSLAIATHEEDKGPYATIKSPYVNKTAKEAKAMADEAINSPDWIQVGMDPERHSYFYDRQTQQPVIGGTDVIQIGPLVLVKNPKYDDLNAIDNQGEKKYPY